MQSWSLVGLSWKNFSLNQLNIFNWSYLISEVAKGRKELFQSSVSRMQKMARKSPSQSLTYKGSLFLVHWSHLLYFTMSNIPTQQFLRSEKNILRKAIKDIRLHMFSSIMYDVKYSLSKYHLIFSYHDIHWIQFGGNLAVNSH